MGITIKDKAEEAVYLAALDCITAICKRRTQDETQAEMITPDGDRIETCITQIGGVCEGDPDMIGTCLLVAKFIDGLHRIRE